MDCPVCRTSNTSGIKYCVNCGRNLESLPEITYGQVDKGIYHTEEEYLSENSGFEISDNTFTINDRTSSYMSNNFLTPAELSNTEEFDFGGSPQNESPIEEFDFGGSPQNESPVEEFDFGGSPQNESPVEEFDFGGSPQNESPVEEFDFGGSPQNESPVEEFDFGGSPQNESPVEEFGFGGSPQNESPVEEFDFGGSPQNESPVEEFGFGGSPQNESPVEEFDFGGKTEENIIKSELKQENDEVLSSQPYSDYANNSVLLQAKPYTDMYGTPPQIIGYDQNGMPVYAQSPMYPQSQFIGYDQNGMPVYSQPMVCQPQIIGYDQNGMPIYSQPVVCQPQIIGYDQNGMPVYSQPVSYPQSQVMNYAHPSVYVEKVQQQQPVDKETEKFRDFLDDGKNETVPIQKEEDFFSKSSDMGDVALPDLDIGGLKKREKKKKVYMTDVEIQDAENLVPNNASKFNQKYMRRADESGSGDLGEKTTHRKRVEMSQTKTADPRLLNPKFQYKSRIKMGDATTAQADDFNTKTVRQRKVSMAEADNAVEAMPKKKKYVDELDLIELPEYMQARKKSKKDKSGFPGMSDL